MDDVRPILKVDLSAKDRDRIRDLLRSYGLDCTEEQAEQLRRNLRSVDLSDDELFEALSEVVEVDWNELARRLADAR